MRMDRPSAFASSIAKRRAFRLAFEPSIPTTMAWGSATADFSWCDMYASSCSTGWWDSRYRSIRDRGTHHRHVGPAHSNRDTPAPGSSRGQAAASRRIRNAVPCAHHALTVNGKETYMGIIAFLILGLIAGAIAKAILPGRQGGGWIGALICGVIGALVGGWIGGAVFGEGVDAFFSLSSW